MLLRFDPFAELDRRSQDLNDWFNTPAKMPMDAVRSAEKVVISFDLPGVDADSIDVEVDNHVLSVSATRDSATERREGDEVLVHERRHGRFVRQVSLGDNLDTSRLEADYHDGVLRVTVPVAEQAKVRKVEVSRRAHVDTSAVDPAPEAVADSASSDAA